MKKMTILEHLRKLALRMLSDSRGHMAELEGTVAGALEELNASKQDKIPGTAGQVVGFNAKREAVAQNAAWLPLTGGALTGAVTVQAPTASMNPATKKYVDDLVGEVATLLDTINGEVV